MGSSNSEYRSGQLKPQDEREKEKHLVASGSTVLAVALRGPGLAGLRNVDGGRLDGY